MSLFVGTFEKRLLQNFNEEIIKDITDQYVDYYQVNAKISDRDKLYGESISKTFKHPIRLSCLVDYEEPTSFSGREGVDTSYIIEVQFSRDMLSEASIYPREGDFVFFGEIYYEIKNVIEAKIVDGRAYDDWKWDIICQCSSSRIDQLNIVDSHN